MPHACFYVSGHGHGHSSRVQAVLELLLEDSTWTVELRTSSPRWFHEWLLSERCTHHPVELDPGVVQRDAFHHDPRATRLAWQGLLDRAKRLVEREARHLADTGCAVVVGDVVPLAFPAARAAAVPSLAMGNFTWDWILEHYLVQEPELEPVIREIRRMYAMAGQYLRLPMSHPTDVFGHQRELDLVARRCHAPAGEVRASLGLGREQVLLLICFGGVGFSGVNLERVSRHPLLRCVWDRPETIPDLLLSVDPRTHYPDLIRAADLILTKPGYGIFAEAMAHRTPVAYAHRDGFREAALLEAHLARRWPSVALSLAQLEDGTWVEPTLSLAGKRCPPVSSGGAAEAVAAIKAAARGQAWTAGS